MNIFLPAFIGQVKNQFKTQRNKQSKLSQNMTALLEHSYNPQRNLHSHFNTFRTPRSKSASYQQSNQQFNLLPQLMFDSLKTQEQSAKITIMHPRTIRFSRKKIDKGTKLLKQSQFLKAAAATQDMVVSKKLGETIKANPFLFARAIKYEKKAEKNINKNATIAKPAANSQKVIEAKHNKNQIKFKPSNKIKALKNFSLDCLDCECRPWSPRKNNQLEAQTQSQW